MTAIGEDSTSGARRGLVSFTGVAKLMSALILGVAMLLTIDWVSAAVVLALTLLLLPLTRIPAAVLWPKLWPFLIVASFAAVTTVLYGRDSGTMLWNWGPITVTEGSVSFAEAIFLRVLAIAVPNVVLLVATDPTELADGMSQILRLPSRFVLGTLAGIRLIGLFVEDWRELALARRARGIGDGGRLRRFAGEGFALLVIALRRGSVLATAMESRGFGAPVSRTWARPVSMHARDWGLVAVCAAVAGCAVAVSVGVGAWSFVLGL